MDYSPVPLKSAYDYLAPDTSEIRLLCQGRTAGLAHCTLPAGQVSTAVKHRKVEECWYVLQGKGQIWREEYGVSDITPGISVVIPPKSGFQFRADQSGPLQILIVTIPPWPGADEAEPVKGFWA